MKSRADTRRERVLTRIACCARVPRMAHTLYKLDVKLLEIEPPIWRTIELAGSSDVRFEAPETRRSQPAVVFVIEWIHNRATPWQTKKHFATSQPPS